MATTKITVTDPDDLVAYIRQQVTDGQFDGQARAWVDQAMTVADAASEGRSGRAGTAA